MGNACCRSASVDDDSDRAHIINNTNNNNNYNYDIPQSDGLGGGGRAGIGGEYYINFNGSPPNDEIPYGSFSCGNKTQEQAALDRIYHRLALNVIDVAPGETMIIQPAEICERQKAYQSRLNQLEGVISLTLTKTGGVESSGNLFNAHKLISRLKIPPIVEPISTILAVANENSNNIINRQKLYQIPDRRRVEYEAIPQDEEALIGEYSIRSAKAVKSLAPTINEPVITQFNL